MGSAEESVEERGVVEEEEASLGGGGGEGLRAWSKASVTACLMVIAAELKIVDVFLFAT